MLAVFWRSNDNTKFMTVMRERAKVLAKTYGTVTVDDLRYDAEALGLKPTHPNTWGAVFRTGFQPVGHIRSSRRSSRGRTVRIWRAA